MGVLLFFSIALFVFLLGLVVISVTLYHWYKEWSHGKKQTQSTQKSSS